MLVVYLFAKDIDVDHVFVCFVYRCWSCICVLGVSMLVMYLCIRGIDVTSCICVLGVSLLVMYLCVRGIDIGHAFVGYGYRCWLCICVLGVSMLVMYFCVRGIDVGHLFIC